MLNKFRIWFGGNYKSIIRFTYIIPILFVAGVSIAHVISWYSMTNPLSWAIYLSVGIEIAALSALAGMATTLNRAVYIPFGIVTFIQFIGNMFFAFQYIDVSSDLFKDWVILMDPFFNLVGMNNTGDIDGHRRWLAVFGGALLPLISLSFLHLLVKFNDKENSESTLKVEDSIPYPPTPLNDIDNTPLKVSGLTPNECVNDCVNEGVNEGVNDNPEIYGNYDDSINEIMVDFKYVDVEGEKMIIDSETYKTNLPLETLEVPKDMLFETQEEEIIEVEEEIKEGLEPIRDVVTPKWDIKRGDIIEVKNKSNLIQRIGPNKFIKKQ